MEWVSVCVWVTTAPAVQQNRLSFAVISERPLSQVRAAGLVACLRGTGCALELAMLSKQGGPLVSHQLGQRASRARRASYSRSTHAGPEKLPRQMIVVAPRPVFSYVSRPENPHSSGQQARDSEVEGY